MDLLFGEENAAKGDRVHLSSSAQEEVIKDMGDPAWVRYMPKKSAASVSGSKLGRSTGKTQPVKASRPMRKGQFAGSAMLTRRKSNGPDAKNISCPTKVQRGKRSLRDRGTSEKELSMLLDGL